MDDFFCCMECDEAICLGTKKEVNFNGLYCTRLKMVVGEDDPCMLGLEERIELGRMKKAG